MSLPPDRKEIDARASKIRLLILDVDGVLTDGRLTYLPGGEETKTFHVRDGLGVQLLIASGVKVALLSGRDAEVVRRRAGEMGIETMCLGVSDKVEAFEKILGDLDCTDGECAYMGDDLPDLPILERVALGLVPADAAPEMRTRAHVVLRAGGGQGAVREACELVLKARGDWNV